MKILMINGSPRRLGNTALALQVLQEKLQENHEVELLQSYSMAVTPCLSCYECKKNGGYCVQKDDTNAMLQKISDADCIVFGSPVFWGGISGQLKLFIDKFIARTEAFKKQSKKVVNIVVGASDPNALQYKLIEDQFDSICQFIHWEHIKHTSFTAFGMGDIVNCTNFDSKIQEIADAINQ